mmetsp:Transcript_30015/g.80289  ORF Transcript_30015/g.80289 Transcript_30015/m.80289 type:complete len:200 (-) Transcript_30015:870-1469(-)
MRLSFLRRASMSCRWNLRSRPMSCFSCSALSSSCLFSMPAPLTSVIMDMTASLRLDSSALALAPVSACACRRDSATEVSSRSFRIFICSLRARSESTSVAFSRLACMARLSAPRRASSSWRSSSILSASHCLFATSSESFCLVRSESIALLAFADLASASVSLCCSPACRSSNEVRKSVHTLPKLPSKLWTRTVDKTST